MTYPTTEENLKILETLTPEQCKKLLSTPPNLARYPNTNQAKACYAAYNEFFRCEKFKGKGNKECFYLKQSYFSRCPMEWVERWDAQREAGNFAGPM